MLDTSRLLLWSHLNVTQLFPAMHKFDSTTRLSDFENNSDNYFEADDADPGSPCDLTNTDRIHTVHRVDSVSTFELK